MEAHRQLREPRNLPSAAMKHEQEVMFPPFTSNFNNLYLLRFHPYVRPRLRAPVRFDARLQPDRRALQLERRTGRGRVANYFLVCFFCILPENGNPTSLRAYPTAADSSSPSRRTSPTRSTRRPLRSRPCPRRPSMRWVTTETTNGVLYKQSHQVVEELLLRLL